MFLFGIAVKVVMYDDVGVGTEEIGNGREWCYDPYNFCGRFCHVIYTTAETETQT